MFPNIAAIKEHSFKIQNCGNLILQIFIDLVKIKICIFNITFFKIGGAEFVRRMEISSSGYFTESWGTFCPFRKVFRYS